MKMDGRLKLFRPMFRSLAARHFVLLARLAVATSPRLRFFALVGSATIATAAWTTATENAIRWDAKNAYLKCERAIDGTIAWPSEPEAICVAMLMCANESVLSAERHRRLIEQIRRMPGCGEP